MALYKLPVDQGQCKEDAMGLTGRSARRKARAAAKEARYQAAIAAKRADMVRMLTTEQTQRNKARRAFMLRMLTTMDNTIYDPDYADELDSIAKRKKFAADAKAEEMLTRSRNRGAFLRIKKRGM